MWWLCRFTQFIVCLAHRVIALWFIRSRMQYRRTIAHFIIKVGSVVGRKGGGAGWRVDRGRW